MKSLGVCYWYVKMPWCGCVEHGLEYSTFYVQKHMAPLAVCSGPPLVLDGLLRRPHLWDSRFVTLLPTSVQRSFPTSDFVEISTYYSNVIKYETYKRSAEMLRMI